jgi:cytochrome c
MKLPRVIMTATFFGLAWGASSASVMAGDAAAGKRVFNKCKVCHALEAGKKGVGPSLHGLFGRVAGTVEGFTYSKDMKAAGAKGLVWSEEIFVKYIADPKPIVGSFIGKKQAATKMVFPGLKKQKDRDDLLAYLKEATK